MDSDVPGQPIKRRKNARRCKLCGEFPTPENPLSDRGKHYPCGEKAVVQNTRSMRAKMGPYYQRWAAGMIAAIETATGGEVILNFEDQQPESPSIQGQEARRLA